MLFPRSCHKHQITFSLIMYERKRERREREVVDSQIRLPVTLSPYHLFILFSIASASGIPLSHSLALSSILSPYPARFFLSFSDGDFSIYSPSFIDGTFSLFPLSISVITHPGFITYPAQVPLPTNAMRPIEQETLHSKSLRCNFRMSCRRNILGRILKSPHICIALIASKLLHEQKRVVIPPQRTFLTYLLLTRANSIRPLPRLQWVGTCRLHQRQSQTFFFREEGPFAVSR